MAALVRGGIEQVEVTIDTPGALDAVAGAAGEGRTVGVGTIVDSEQVRAAAAAGARFVVSPGLVPEVIETAHELGLEPMPGVFTATEILTATAAGARVMKLFPASSGGPSYLRALRGPFPRSRSSRRAGRPSGRARPRETVRGARVGTGARRTRPETASSRARPQPSRR